MDRRRPAGRDRAVGGLTVTVPVAAVAMALVAATDGGTPTATDATSVGIEGTFSGFTLGAALLAVLVGGVYWYYRR
jgi:hypothetical protein